MRKVAVAGAPLEEPVEIPCTSSELPGVDDILEPAQNVRVLNDTALTAGFARSMAMTAAICSGR